MGTLQDLRSFLIITHKNLARISMPDIMTKNLIYLLYENLIRNLECPEKISMRFLIFYFESNEPSIAFLG